MTWQAIYILSYDHQFEEQGPDTDIDYHSAFLEYKERIEKHENTTRFRQIINMWNTRLFHSQEESVEDAPEATDTGLDDIAARSAMIDAALSMDDTEAEHVNDLSIRFSVESESSPGFEPSGECFYLSILLYANNFRFADILTF